MSAYDHLRKSLGLDEAARKTPRVEFDADAVEAAGVSLTVVGRKLEAASKDPKKIKKLAAEALMHVSVLTVQLNKKAVTKTLRNQAKRIDPNVE